MKRASAVILTLLLLLGLFCGCSKANDTGNYKEEAYDRAEVVGAVGTDGEVAVGATGQTAVANTQQKLIRTVRLSVETENYEALLSDIETKAGSVGGYMESIDANTRYGADSRHASVCLRIPADELDGFLTAVSGMSNVVSRSEDVRDITLSYADTESERNALRVEQERLLALLEKAESLSDVLEIEGRLTDVRYRLNSIESQLRTYDNQVDYATLYLEISEVTVLTPVAEVGFWQKIGDGFVHSAATVWNFLKSAFSYAIIAIPYLAVLLLPGVIALVVVLIVRKCKRKS